MRVAVGVEGKGGGAGDRGQAETGWALCAHCKQLFEKDGLTYSK